MTWTIIRICSELKTTHTCQEIIFLSGGETIIVTIAESKMDDITEHARGNKLYGN